MSQNRGANEPAIGTKKVTNLAKYGEDKETSLEGYRMDFRKEV
jgi:hypothetical protein